MDWLLCHKDLFHPDPFIDFRIFSYLAEMKMFVNLTCVSLNIKTISSTNLSQNIFHKSFTKIVGRKRFYLDETILPQ